MVEYVARMGAKRNVLRDVLPLLMFGILAQFAFIDKMCCVSQQILCSKFDNAVDCISNFLLKSQRAVCKHVVDIFCLSVTARLLQRKILFFTADTVHYIFIHRHSKNKFCLRGRVRSQYLGPRLALHY